MADITVTTFTVKSTVNLNTIVVSTYGDGNFIREDQYSTSSFTVSQAEANALFTADAFGVLDKGNQNFYKKQQPQQPVSQSAPPSPAPTPVAKDTKLKQPRYLPQFSYTKPKSTSGGEFVIKKTGDEYKGFYIKTTDNKYYSGRKPEDNGEELEEMTATFVEDLMPLAVNIVGLLKGFFKPTIKKGDKERGKLQRFFIQPKTTQKITEVDKQTYHQAQNQLINYNFAQVDWIIKGPADDQVINGYPFEGAASKNKKAIQALESQMPGISTFVTNYSELVEEPVIKKDLVLESQTTLIPDPLVELENSRKANFDLRK